MNINFEKSVIWKKRHKKDHLWEIVNRDFCVTIIPQNIRSRITLLAVTRTSSQVHTFRSGRTAVDTQPMPHTLEVLCRCSGASLEHTRVHPTYMCLCTCVSTYVCVKGPHCVFQLLMFHFCMHCVEESQATTYICMNVQCVCVCMYVHISEGGDTVDIRMLVKHSAHVKWGNITIQLCPQPLESLVDQKSKIL